MPNWWADIFLSARRPCVLRARPFADGANRRGVPFRRSASRARAFRALRLAIEQARDDLAVSANDGIGRNIAESGTHVSSAVRGESPVVHDLQIENFGQRFNGLHAAPERAGENQGRT